MAVSTFLVKRHDSDTPSDSGLDARLDNAECIRSETGRDYGLTVFQALPR